jgi:hypothetical protein
MDKLEYCLFICAVRAERKGCAKLSEDLYWLATIHHTYESPGSDYDKAFDEIYRKLSKYNHLTWKKAKA